MYYNSAYTFERNMISDDAISGNTIRGNAISRGLRDIRENTLPETSTSMIVPMSSTTSLTLAPIISGNIASTAVPYAFATTFAPIISANIVSTSPSSMVTTTFVPITTTTLPSPSMTSTPYTYTPITNTTTSTTFVPLPTTTSTTFVPFKRDKTNATVTTPSSTTTTPNRNLGSRVAANSRSR